MMGALLAIAMVAAIAGCGDSGSGAPPAAASPISLTRSGGVASSTESIVISDPAELEELRPAIADADLGELGPGGQTGCADCYVYTVEYAGTKVTRDESAMPAGFARLVDALEQAGG